MNIRFIIQIKNIKKIMLIILEIYRKNIEQFIKSNLYIINEYNFLNSCNLIISKFRDI